MYYTYMIRCEDNSIYTGITNDIKRRIQEHFYKDEKGAKYTKSHSVKKLECVWQSENRVLASKLEYHIKALTKNKKEDLIKNHKLDDIFIEKVECKKYKYIKNKIIIFNQMRNNNINL